ncbi:MAG: nucleotidyltransferase domain-containing protein [candidate division WOR-3 bacterium]|nr:nucleotidyltransferase domain-containing protein [candidate division WOR-3 bacterium]
MIITDILQEFRKEIIRLYGKRFVKIILYGSWAREQATKESDIDILVVLKGKVIPGREIDRMIDIITKINLKYGLLISVYPISENKYYKVKSPLLLNVRNDGVVI